MKHDRSTPRKTELLFPHQSRDDLWRLVPVGLHLSVSDLLDNFNII